MKTGRADVNDLTTAAPIFELSSQMRSILTIIDNIADTDATVLVRGESGVGKDLVARAVHARSTRRHGSFVRVNCAAIPSGLLESELFGHEKGAFTGAVQRKLGRFEFANQGTIYLDEIGDLSLELQAKLLHVLQDFRFSRVGGHAMIEVDARVVAATNRDLETAMARLEFREDLYYRLNVVELRIPPLRGSICNTAGRSGSRPKPCRSSTSTRGPATCASSRTRSAAWWCWPTASMSSRRSWRRAGAGARRRDSPPPVRACVRSRAAPRAKPSGPRSPRCSSACAAIGSRPRGSCGSATRPC